MKGMHGMIGMNVMNGVNGLNGTNARSHVQNQTQFLSLTLLIFLSLTSV